MHGQSVEKKSMEGKGKMMTDFYHGEGRVERCGPYAAAMDMYSTGKG